MFMLSIIGGSALAVLLIIMLLPNVIIMVVFLVLIAMEIYVQNVMNNAMDVIQRLK